MRRLSAAAFAALATLAAGAAQAGTVPLDHVVRLPLSGSAAEVVVGSPKYLDVTVVSPRTVLVHGKALGVTNLIIYDGAGRTVYNERIAVVAHAGEEVSVFRGKQTEDFVCSGGCRPTTPAEKNPWMAFFEAAETVRDKSGSTAAAKSAAPPAAKP